MSKKEITEKLKKVKFKMKAIKKDNYEEYLKLRDERLKLEAELAAIKKNYYAAEEAAAKIKIRKTADHKKFIYGGLIVKYYGYIDENELEKKLQIIANPNQINQIKTENNKDDTDDLSEYLQNV
ncbi:MAG: hypothetical protein ACYCT7_04235 [bacterium]